MFSTPHRRHIGWALLWASAAVVFFGILAVLLSTRQLAEEVRNTQLEGTPTGQKLLASSERVLDCTSPEGQCFKDGQKRTASAVGDINRVVILAAACASALPGELTVDERQVEIQACVIDRLSQDDKP